MQDPDASALSGFREWIISDGKGELFSTFGERKASGLLRIIIIFVAHNPKFYIYYT